MSGNKRTPPLDIQNHLLTILLGKPEKMKLEVVLDKSHSRDTHN